MGEEERGYLDAVLHHSRYVVRETARVLDLQIGRHPHEQSDDAGQVDPEEERHVQLRAMLPHHRHLAVDQTQQRQDHTAVEVGVEGEQPAVLHHVGQVVLQVDGVERAHRTRAHAEQRAAQREVELAVHSGRVSDHDHDARKHGAERRSLAEQQIIDEGYHGNAQRAGNLVKGHFHILETEITHCNHQAKKNGKRKHSQRQST